MPRIYVSLDLEFTGLDPRRDEIIEIGMVKFRGDEVLDTFTSLVGARRRLPLKIEQMIGVSQEEIDRAPSFASLRGKVLSFVGSHPLIGHNIEMDLRFLRAQQLVLQNVALDTFELASILIPEARRYSLAALAELLDIDVTQSHRALGDAMATKELFMALLHRAQNWDMAILTELTQLAAGGQWPPLQVFQDILADRANEGTFFGRRDQPTPVSLRPPQEEDLPPLQPAEKITPVDAEALSTMLSPGGLFERSFSGYEFRPQQVDMLKAIAEAFDIPSHLLVEAGTGTGKSVAYLLPAAYFAAQNGQRVIISSNTINLQDQLYNKDVPDLQRILPISFSVAMLKGRANYVCLRRLTGLRRSTRLSVDETRVLAKVLAWLPTTRSGDRTELLLFSSENDIWAQLQSSSETCMGDHCPYFRTGECFFQRARARAERAHLVIINHALLLSDLMLDNRILPEYQYLIVDEAHHLEEQATNQFGFAVGRQDIHAFLNNLGHERNDLPGGLLAQVPVLFTREGLSETVRQAITKAIDETNTQINTAEQRLYDLFNVVERFLTNHAEAGNKSDYDRETRLTEGLRIQPDWSDIEIAWESLSAPLRQVLNGLERLASHIEHVGSSEDAERDELLQDVRTYLQRGTEMWGALNQILFEPSANGIYWVTTAQRTQEITLNSAPLHVGPLLRERLFDEKACVVLTSATLRTEGSFSYIESRLNLEDPMELALDSPFDLKSAVLLYVPKDMPEPNQPFYQKQVEQSLVDLCKATEGRTLVLFTSNSQLHATYHAIQPALEQEGIVVFGQGLDGSRMQVTDNFRSTPKSVLLGTRSFWEGIDIVGQALSCLVITRLPFAVPTDPVFAARAETFDDAFNQYYLPDAILRFRQGFGRLVRSKDDYGIIVLLDNRLLTRAYGKTILRSLPPCTARQGPLASLPAVAQRWLDPTNRS